jgi:hypothetical protein
VKTIAWLLLVLLPTTPVRANCFGSGCYLFYGGDFDPNNLNANGLANETDGIVGGSPYGAATFQNFVIPASAQTWNVGGLFTNDLMSLSPSTAYWELRTGILEGSSGILIASGTAADTVSPTGRAAFGLSEYTNLVSVNLSLVHGIYWFSVVPNDQNNHGRSFNTNTFGSNSAGTQVSDLQYCNSPFLGANYTNADNEGVFPTLSSGVIAQTTEPSTLVMLGSGLLAAACVVRRQSSRRARIKRKARPQPCL